MLPTLRTERLILRPLVEEDAAALHIAFSDDIVMQWWSSRPHATVDETRAYISSGQSDGRWQSWAITEDGGDALGRVVLGERRHGVGELGYILRRDHWALACRCGEARIGMRRFAS